MLKTWKRGEFFTDAKVKFLRSEVILRIVKFCSITRKVSLKRCHPERSASGVEPVRAMLCIGISPFPPRLPAARDPARLCLALLRSSTSLRMTRAKARIASSGNRSHFHFLTPRSSRHIAIPQSGIISLFAKQTISRTEGAYSVRAEREHMHAPTPSSPLTSLVSSSPLLTP